MAEINTNAGSHRHQAAIHRCKKLSVKIDLTPMVDLGFLLISFFIFTTSMTRPTAMKLYLPAGEPGTDYTESTCLTLIPLSGNKIFYYYGRLEAAMHQHAYGISGFSVTTGIGSIIRKKQTALDRGSKFSRNNMELIIKPSPLSSYQNIVDILDEVLINNVKHYTLTDMDKGEKDMLRELHAE